jgi:TPR repeat protein
VPVEWLDRRCHERDPAVSAEMWRGECRNNGLGFDPSRSHREVKTTPEAVKWFRRAADQGDPDAQYNLGLMYEKGRGVSQDDAEALEWYRRAEDQGNAAAVQWPRSNSCWMQYERPRPVDPENARLSKQRKRRRQRPLGAMSHSVAASSSSYVAANTSSATTDISPSP